MEQSSKCLVIDTDSARAAGVGNTMDTKARDCRTLLLTVRDTEHKVVFTEAIRTEWRKHESRFSRIWRISMIEHDQICAIDVPPDDELRRDIEEYAITISAKRRDEMLKDTHLIEAAIQADKIVISMDKKIRNWFGNATHQIPALALIAWANPCIDEDSTIDWLRGGAPLEKERLLGYREENSMN